VRYATDPTKECSCTPLQIQRYLARISGPLLDRIDIHIDVPPLKHRELSGDRPATVVGDSRARRAGAPPPAGALPSEQGVLQRSHEHAADPEALPGGRRGEKPAGNGDGSTGAIRSCLRRILKVGAHDRGHRKRGTHPAENIAEAIQYRSLDRGPRR